MKMGAHPPFPVVSVIARVCVQASHTALHLPNKAEFMQYVDNAQQRAFVYNCRLRSRDAELGLTPPALFAE